MSDQQNVQPAEAKTNISHYLEKKTPQSVEDTDLYICEQTSIVLIETVYFSWRSSVASHLKTYLSCL